MGLFCIYHEQQPGKEHTHDGVHTKTDHRHTGGCRPGRTCNHHLAVCFQLRYGLKKGAVIMLLLIFFLIWSIIGTILGFILKVIFHILPIKTIIAFCLIGYALHMLGIHFL